jgi:hypothetical protein
VLITNDIWLGTGHLPDITLAKPIFREGRLVAFSATTARPTSAARSEPRAARGLRGGTPQSRR